MKTKNLILVSILLSFYVGTFSQKYLKGYQEEVSGKRFTYHST